MSKQGKLIIGILIAAAVAIAVTVFSILSERIPMNPNETAGNTPGNLLNGGLFCEVNGRVYFSNVEDSETLYVMNPDESNVKNLGSMGVSSICGAGRFLYFIMDSTKYSHGKGLGYVGNTFGVYRYRIRDGKLRCLERARARSLQLCGSNLYFNGSAEDGNGLFKIRIDGNDRGQISDSYIPPAGYDGQYLYYGGVSGDPSLFYLNTNLNNKSSRVMEGNVSSPIPLTDYIYYIDNAADYHISRFNRVTRASEEIGTERVDFYNTDGQYIWYSVSVGDHPGLRRMRMNGDDVITVADGIYNSIHITSQFVYFAPYDGSGSASVMYHVPINAPALVSRFSPGE